MHDLDLDSICLSDHMLLRNVVLLEGEEGKTRFLALIRSCASVRCMGPITVVLYNEFQMILRLE